MQINKASLSPGAKSTAPDKSSLGKRKCALSNPFNVASRDSKVKKFSDPMDRKKLAKFVPFEGLIKEQPHLDPNVTQKTEQPKALQSRVTVKNTTRVVVNPVIHENGDAFQNLPLEDTLIDSLDLPPIATQKIEQPKALQSRVIAENTTRILVNPGIHENGDASRNLQNEDTIDTLIDEEF